MKGRIFMYLFIFSLLLVLFQLINSKNVHEADAKRIEDLQSKITTYKDSLEVLEDKAFALSEFSISYSDEALEYIEKRGFDSDELIVLIEETLYDLNLSPEDHPLIPYAAMSPGGKMIINAIRVLNHKWIIANFNDGEYWGEVFLTYEITEKKELKFNLVEYFLYPFD